MDHSRNSLPNESCALLLGNIEDGNNIVQEIFLTENIDMSPVKFTIADEQLIKGYSLAESRRVSVIGIFHSHPHSSPYPSETDKKFMQSNPVVWMIHSGLSNEIRSYILEQDIVEIPTVIL